MSTKILASVAFSSPLTNHVLVFYNAKSGMYRRRHRATPLCGIIATTTTRRHHGASSVLAERNRCRVRIEPRVE